MIKVAHRINTIEELTQVPLKYGVEIDVRTFNNELVLNHEPNKSGDSFNFYASVFQHKFLIIDVKEEGIERDIIKVCKENNIENYFLLGVTFPFMLQLAQEGFRKMAIRYSEYEDIKTVMKMKGLVDWVWIDTFTKLPIIHDFLLEHFMSALVSPCRWRRAREIKEYKKKFIPTLVMTEMKYMDRW